MKKGIKTLGLIFALFLVFCFLFTSFSYCQEMPKPGEVIDKTNYKKYAHLFPELFLPGFEDGWGGLMKPLSIKVSETQSAPIPKRFLALSEKNRGKYTFDQNGMILGGYDSSGLPFPGVTPADKDFATKFMWNYGYNYGGDDVREDVRTSTQRKGEQVRTMYSPSAYMYFAGRIYDDPKPIYPNNPEKIYSIVMFHYTVPTTMKNFQLMTYRYLNLQKSNDTYLYLPQMRRVLRGESSQNSTPIAGSTQAPDDFFGGFWGKPQQFTYRYLGEQKVLSPMRSPMSAAYSDKSLAANSSAMPFASDNWEIRDAYIIEIKSKDPQYPQSKKVCYIDKENLRSLYASAWDRAGKPWKTWANYWGPVPLADGDKLYVSKGMIGIELQFGMSSLYAANGPTNGQGLSYIDFMPASMLKRAR